MKYTAKKLLQGKYYYRGLVIEFVDYFGVKWHDSTNTLSDAKQLVDDIYFNNEGERIWEK